MYFNDKLVFLAQKTRRLAELPCSPRGARTASGCTPSAAPHTRLPAPTGNLRSTKEATGQPAPLRLLGVSGVHLATRLSSKAGDLATTLKERFTLAVTPAVTHSQACHRRHFDATWRTLPRHSGGCTGAELNSTGTDFMELRSTRGGSPHGTGPQVQGTPHWSTGWQGRQAAWESRGTEHDRLCP